MPDSEDVVLPSIKESATTTQANQWSLMLTKQLFEELKKSGNGTSFDKNHGATGSCASADSHFLRTQLKRQLSL